MSAKTDAVVPNVVSKCAVATVSVNFVAKPETDAENG